MLQTLEPRWTLQGAPVGRLFVSSKGDLAHIVGRVSQSMQQTPNARGRWAAQRLPLPRRASTSQHGLLPHWPAPSHSRRGRCRFVTYGVLWPCILPLASAQTMALITPSRGSGVEGMARPPTTPSLHAAAPAPAAALSRPLVRRLHHTAPDHLRPLVTTIATQVLCWPSHSMMTERAHQPIFKSSIHHRLRREGSRALSAPHSWDVMRLTYIGAPGHCPTHRVFTSIHKPKVLSILHNRLGSF